VTAFFKWLFDNTAKPRPGALGYLSLAIAAVCVLPGLMWLVTGDFLAGLALIGFSGLALTGGLRGPWERYRKHHGISDGQAIPSALMESSPDFDAELNDEFTDLRTRLKSHGQDDAVRQLNLFKQQMIDFRSVLDNKLQPGEMTAVRYDSAAQKVYTGALHNLESIANFAQSVRTLDGERLMTQLDELIAAGNGNSDTAAALRERIGLMSEGQRHIKALLETNEEAITSLTRVTTKLATVSTDKSGVQGADAMSSLITDLDALAERTSRYSASMSDNQAVLIATGTK